MPIEDGVLIFIPTTLCCVDNMFGWSCTSEVQTGCRRLVMNVVTCNVCKPVPGWAVAVQMVVSCG